MKRTTSHTARDQAEMTLAADSFCLLLQSGPVARNIDGTPLARLPDNTVTAPELLPERDHDAKRTQEARPWFQDDRDEMPAYDPRGDMAGADFSGGSLF